MAVPTHEGQSGGQKGWAEKGGRGGASWPSGREGCRLLNLPASKATRNKPPRACTYVWIVFQIWDVPVAQLKAERNLLRRQGLWHLADRTGEIFLPHTVGRGHLLDNIASSQEVRRTVFGVAQADRTPFFVFYRMLIVLMFQNRRQCQLGERGEGRGLLER